MAERVSPLQGNSVPDRILTQRWSALNVPLMWAAAGQAEDNPRVEWLAAQCEEAVLRAGANHDVVAARAAWHALRECMRSLGIGSQDDLRQWFQPRGWNVGRQREFVPRDVQESLLDMAVALNANVADIEKAYVTATLRLARQSGLREDLRVNLLMRGRNDPSRAAAHARQPHRVAEAEAEMAAAGLGAPELAEKQPESASRRNRRNATAAEPATRAERRGGEFLRTLGYEPFRPIPRPRVRVPTSDRLPAEPPSHAWESLDATDLREEFFRRRCVLKAGPRLSGDASDTHNA